MKEIYLAGGCFWGTEHYFKQIAGVVSTEVGFANGHTDSPTYRDVYTDQTGYAETVRISYDEQTVSLEFLLNMFFKAIDPTSLNRQGHDEGTRYRTGVYYTDADSQLPVIRKVFDEQQALLSQPIAVEVEPLSTFWPAEEEHQDYLDKHPDGYCHLPLELFAMARRARPLALLLCLLVSTLALALPVTRDQARRQAALFLSAGGRRAAAVSPAAMQLATAGYYRQADGRLAPCYYVFNVGTDDGYVVAGGDDSMPAVLGYADRGTFDADHLPDNMRAWMQGYADQMEWLSRHPADAARKTVSGGSISPLLGTVQWDQGWPYNLLCPQQDDKYCMTGCVATAMAQIMYYHQWPAQTTAEIPAYTSSSGGYMLPAIPAGTAIGWADMLPQYHGGETTDQQQAVASLMLMCGTAVHMNYAPGGSTAYSGEVAVAWRNYFDYDLSLSYEDRSAYRLAQWSQKVYDELAAGRPVYYSGQSTGGGHAFVIDGYSSDDFFHVNWGWSGSSNGYFLLSILDPDNSTGAGATASTDGYSYDQGAIFGICKNTGQPVAQTVALTVTSLTLPADNSYERSSASDDFSFGVTASLWNQTGQERVFEWAVGLFDADDSFVQQVSSTAQTASLPPGWGYSALTIDLTFGAQLPDGAYTLKTMSREKGTSEWHTNFGSDTYCLSAIVSGTTVSVTAPFVSLEGTIAATGRTEAGTGVPVDASITNHGTLFNSQIFFLVDGQLTGGRHLDLDAGQTAVVPFMFTPATAGTKTLSVCLRAWNSSAGQYDYTPFATGSVAIDAAQPANLDITYKVTNATNYVVKENVIKLLVTAKNNGSSDYDNDLRAALYKDGHDGYYYYLTELVQPLQVAQGQQQTAAFDFANLENESYLMVVSYKSEGNWKTGAQTYVYSVDADDEPQQPVVEGDVNGDGVLDAADVQLVISYIHGNAAPGADYSRADMDGNGVVDVFDVTKMLSVILGGAAATSLSR